MAESNVEIECEIGDPDNDRHSERYRRCLYELIKELGNIPEAKTVLDKYFAYLGEEYRVNLDFPDDFDQKTLPEDLQ